MQQEAILGRMQAIGWDAWTRVNLILSEAEKTPDGHSDDHTDDSLLEKAGPGTVVEGIKTRIRDVRTANGRRELKALPVDEKRERKSWIKRLAHLGFSPEQMVGILPALGFSIGRSQIYEYMGQIKLPRNYRRKIAEMEHHDSMVLWTASRLATDCGRLGWRWSSLRRDESPCVGARMRPDFQFEVGPYLFFLEVQLSDLSDTLWRKKLHKYIRLRKLLGRKFKVIVIIDTKRDMHIVRRAAKELMQQWGNANASMFLFLPLIMLKGRDDLARGKHWIDEHGVMRALLEWIH